MRFRTFHRAPLAGRATRRSRWCARILLGLVAIGSASAFAQGLGKDDREGLAESRTFQAGAREGEVPSTVDLRPFLPAVGRQTMNDCAAWAFGYAARTYLEVVDQGWKPTATRHIFSPTWIYNQVNGGKDSGSSPVNVLTLLREQGAATLSNQPYLAKDFRTTPTARAKQEAGAFRIDGVRWLPSGAAVRTALAEGHIVVCGVRTNPLFNSGRYPLYTPELHTRGQAERQPGQPHGFHAMVICGYSDEKRAFIFMNSWGKSWGDGGFCYVDYDVAATFNRSDVTEHLMEFAVVMLDRRRPVAENNGLFREVDPEGLQLRVTAVPTGWDLGADLPRWSVGARLDGPAEQLDGISSVGWTLAGATRRSINATVRDNAFAAASELGGREFEVQAKVQLRGGQAIDLSTKLTPESLPRRDVEIERLDRYWGVSVGADRWAWRLVPKLSATDWQQLKSIEWPGLQAFTGSSSVIKRYDHDGSIVLSAQDLATQLPLAFTKTIPPGSAKLTFRDGQVYDVPLPTAPFTAATERGYRFEAEWRPEGSLGDRHWYYYELRLVSPLSIDQQIDAVHFEMDTSSTHTAVVARPVRDGFGRIFVHSGFAERPFEARALVRHGKSTDIVSAQVPLGEHSAWPDPNGFSIESEGTYLGEIGGKPRWKMHLRIDGPANIWEVQRVRWKVGDEERDLDWSIANPYDGFAFEIESDGSLDASAQVVRNDGTTLDVRRTVQATTERSDALALQASLRAHELLSVEAPDRRLVDIALVTTASRAQGICALECLVPRPGGSLERVVLGAPYAGAPLREMGGPIEIGAPAPADDAPAVGMTSIAVLVHRTDGSVTEVRAPVLDFSPIPRLPRAQIEARERYVGVVDGRPRWSAELSIHGNLDVLTALSAVQWSAESSDGSRSEPIATGPWSARVEYGSPLQLRAALSFTPASGREDMRVETRTHCRSFAAEITLAARSLWEEPTFWNPNVDPLDLDWPTYEAEVYLDGPSAQLARVRSVTYRAGALVGNSYEDTDLADMEESAEPEIVEVTERRSDTGAFALLRTLGEETSERVSATVTLDDGTLLELGPLHLTWTAWTSTEVEVARSVYWGREDSVALQMVTCTLAPWRDSLSNVPTIDVEYHWNEPPVPTAVPEGGFTQSPDAVRPLGGGPARTYELGQWRRSFLVPDGALLTYARVRSRQHQVTEETSSLYGRHPPLRIDVQAIPDEPVLRVGPCASSLPDVPRVSLRAPESWMSRVRAVEYELEAPSAEATQPVRRTLTPPTRFDAFGEDWGAIVPAHTAWVHARARVSLHSGETVELELDLR